MKLPRFFRAYQIARILAKKEPPLDPELGFCLMCHSEKYKDAYHLKYHERLCPWRMAQEWADRSWSGRTWAGK